MRVLHSKTFKQWKSIWVQIKIYTPIPTSGLAGSYIEAVFSATFLCILDFLFPSCYVGLLVSFMHVVRIKIRSNLVRTSFELKFTVTSYARCLIINR